MIGVYLAAGGAAGAICRYLLGLYLPRFLPKRSFPVSMLMVNILGSFGLGLFFGLAYGEIPEGTEQDALYILLGVGFFSAFTTFSTFSVEAFQLLEKRKYKPLLYYISLSFVGSVVFFLFGLAIELL